VSREEFLKDLEESYEGEFKYKTELDSKAISMITMSGTIATLFMGFGSVLLKDITKDRIEFLVPASVILMAEIILTSLAIGYSINAYKIKDYYQFHKTLKELFFNNDKVDEARVDKYATTDKEFYKKRRRDAYLTGIYLNSDLNKKKVDKIICSQRVFYIALLMIPTFAAIIIVNKFV
jgi:hypothetical protein